MIRFPVDGDAREALLAAAVCAGVIVAVLTEVMSAVGGLTRGWLAMAWGGALAAAGLVAARTWSLRAPHPLRALRALGGSLDLAMAAWIAVVVALTGAIALFAVPITVDSMVYHLARVAHWAQNAAVAFYPAHVIRQLHPPPWAEYAILHVFVLWGGDRLANLVQWISMVLSLVGVSVVARQLGAGVRGQLLSAFVCATIPMGILQASTTQNDYVAAFWLLCLVSSLLAMSSQPGLLPVLAAGASLGLALLTKGTAYVLAAPFVVIFVLADRTRPTSRRLERAVVIGLCALALNAPHYARNVQVFGSPLGPGGEDRAHRYVNDAFWPSILISSVIRNLGLHAGTPWPRANAWLERGIGTIHAWMGIPVDDPRSTWPRQRFEVRPPIVHEGAGGNGLHLLLIVAAALVGVWRARGHRRMCVFAACLVAAFLLFCLLFRWQPWHSRLHLPLFVLGAPLVGVVFERLKPALLAILLLLLTDFSVDILNGYRAHPLVGRQSIFTQPWAEQRVRHAGPAFVGAARVIIAMGCSHVGLLIGGIDGEYFLQALLADAGWKGRLEPVFVGNASAVLYLRSGAPLPPCAIVQNDVPSGTSATVIMLGARSYQTAWSLDGVQVLAPALPPAAK